MSSIVIVPGSVSRGTLRVEDLIHATITELGKVNPKAEQEIFQDTDYQNILWMCKEFDSVGGNEETALWLVEAATDAINEVAPEGYYFGSHPTDPSNIGWWKYATKIVEVVLYNSTTPQGEFSVHASAFSVYYIHGSDEYEVRDRTGRVPSTTIYGTIQDAMLEVGTVLNNNTAINGTVEASTIQIEDY